MACLGLQDVTQGAALALVELGGGQSLQYLLCQPMPNLGRQPALVVLLDSHTAIHQADHGTVYHCLAKFLDHIEYQARLSRSMVVKKAGIRSKTSEDQRLL